MFGDFIDKSVGVNQYSGLNLSPEGATDMAAVKDLISSPAYLAYKFNFNTENVEFLPVDRTELRKVSALKHGYIDPGRQLIAVHLSELLPLLDSASQSLVDNPPRFIFHTAFCASTFLSRCLDVDGVSTSLREPQILLDAANAKRLHWQSKTTGIFYRDLLQLGLLLLQKHAAPSEKLVIKPINSINNIIPELLQITGPTKSLMLYTDARNFILSTLKKAEGGKQTVRSMFDLIRCDFQHLSDLQLTHAIHMTDLRVIMTLWRLQIEQAEMALQQFSPKNEMASLYGEKLIQTPLESLHAVNQYLDLEIPAAQIDSLVKSDGLSADAKNEGEQFSVQKRKEAYQVLERFYGEDLDNGLRWLLRNNPGTKLQPELSGPLPV